MINPELLDILESEWIVSKTDKLMDSLEENYEAKPDAPEEIKRQFEELCKLMTIAG